MRFQIRQRDQRRFDQFLKVLLFAFLKCLLVAGQRYQSAARVWVEIVIAR